MIKIDGENSGCSGTMEEILCDFRKATILTKKILLEIFTPETADKFIKTVVENTLKMKENEDYFVNENEGEENDRTDVLPEEVHGQPGPDRQ